MTYLANTAFDGAALKVVRANRHIDELKAILSEIERTKPYLPAVRKEANDWELRFGDLGPLGLTIPLVVGDAVPNLRAAYDHIWVALSLAASPAATHSRASIKFATFPFHETRQNVKDAVKKGLVKQAFPDTESLVLDDIRPYRDFGGNDLIWSITKLDKIDKHNIIIPTIRINRVGVLDFRAGDSMVFIRNSTFLHSGPIAAGPGPIEYQQDAIVAIDIAFPHGDFLSGESILPTLINMSEATGQVVELFKNRLIGA